MNKTDDDSDITNVMVVRRTLWGACYFDMSQINNGEGLMVGTPEHIEKYLEEHPERVAFTKVIMPQSLFEYWGAKTWRKTKRKARRLWWALEDWWWD